MEEDEIMERSKRKPNRLQNYDYSQNGAYFITICTEDRKRLLSGIVGGGVLDAPYVELTQMGEIVDHQIGEMNQSYQDVQTVKFVIMPNHLHLLVVIDRESCHGGSGPSGTPAPTNMTIPRYISTLKRLCNRKIGKNIWQRSYHDHIIRTESDYQMIWEYIDTNPAGWEKDCFYTEE